MFKCIIIPHTLMSDCNKPCLAECVNVTSGHISFARELVLLASAFSALLKTKIPLQIFASSEYQDY